MKFAYLALIFCLLHVTWAGYAPSKAPDLPDGFCSKATGMITKTTGECMCKKEGKEACQGSECQYAYGASFYHFSCKDCKCV